MSAAEQLEWTREALAHVYDRAYLHHLLTAPNAPLKRFRDGAAVQSALLQCISSLKPPPGAPARSSAWRLYNVLSLRYLEGLSQAEAAAELNVGVRQLKREQSRAVQAVAGMMYGDTDASLTQPVDALSASDGALSSNSADTERGLRLFPLDELLRSALEVLDPVLAQRDLQITVSLHTPLPLAHTDRMAARQLIISAIGWLIHGLAHEKLTIPMDADTAHLYLRLCRPPMALEAHEAGNPHLNTVLQLADSAGVIVQELRAARHEPTLQLIFAASQARRVVMIDDNPDAIRMVGRYLAGEPEFSLIGLTQPEAALQQIAVLQPCCILLDLMMPHRDGWDVLRSLKSYPDTAHIPVVVSSVLREGDLALALGAACVLERPFTAAQLVTALRSAIRPAQPSPAP